MKISSVWAFGLLATLSQPAFAKVSPFAACDLHAPPRGNSDGREAVDPHAADVRPLPLTDRIQACTDALAAPELMPPFWARRIDLLEARAVLELEAKQDDKATADLDAAAAVGKPHEGDHFYVRSAGLGIGMLRAAAMLNGGALAEGQRRWAAISAARPFDMSVQLAAFRQLSSSDAPFTLVAPVADRLQRFGPEAAKIVLAGLLDMGRPKEAIALYAAMPGQPAEATPLTPVNNLMALQIARRLSFVDRALQIAYAKASLGDVAGARALLDSARKQGEAWAAEVPIAGGQAKAMARAGITRDRVIMQVQSSVRAWSAMIDVRLAFDAHRPLDLKPLMEEPTVFEREQLDLLNAVLATAPNGDVLARSEMIRVRLAEYRKNRLDPAFVYAQRPLAEAGDNMTPFHASHGMMHGGTGWKAEPQADGDVTVTFTGYVPSHAVAEMALLGAAEAAKQVGKAAFLIDDVQGFAMVSVSSGAQSDQNAILSVRPIDDTSGPRTMSVATIEAELQPVFASVTGPI